MSSPTDRATASHIAATLTGPATPTTTPTPSRSEPTALAPGGRVGDYRLVKALGEGAFGTVFLAHQESLDRMVALKVTATSEGSRAEGLALAGLEHDHIVKVYAGFADPEAGRHFLCLQYVPGTNLATVIKDLYSPGRPVPRGGQDVLAAIDRHATGESRFDPIALRDREALACDDFPQAVCRLGARLAQALAFAHGRDVLHCDVKPANILLTPYGRPMLADFNVAFDRARRKPGDSGVGGTLAYMAPEHYAAMLGAPGEQTVDERCDVYSLGVVLHELATGARPPRDAGSRVPGNVSPPSVTRLPVPGTIPRELAAVVRRCLATDPEKRYQSANDLAEALTAAGAILAARRALPPADRFARMVVRRPFRALMFFALFPHVVASVLNITYNTVRVELTEEMSAAFVWVVLAYNAVAYPLSVAVGYRLLSRLYVRWRALPDADGPAADDTRRRVLSLGWWAVVMSAAGWLPGGLLFPLGIDVLAGPLPWRIYAHYLISFTLSGLVGMVFSHLGVQAVVLRAFYPACHNPDRFAPAQARGEVERASRLFGPFLWLAAAVPLTGAVLLVAVVDEQLTLGARLLIAGLIGLGMAGVSVAGRMTDRLRKLAAVWTAGTG